MTYDELYGINLDEYCDRHGVTIGELKQKTITDIDILSDRLNELKDDMLSHDFKIVFDTIEKKRRHLDRLCEWEVLNG